ncbi:F0F1 ATP synthase subunit B [Siphonobacter aquaeclarae]|jgi:F-type H+-transporting ATPase subunit b|uniref:ATP synthase subunit b n=1 Tax=Siphonobacter aquaeclarae TaxID=563176 RepID=A0A1G9X3N6_9BACT|nr:F0F1 ATP synthase subunit B [Siphonobacter aquaeclarae]MBO9638908.1 F0F1 ATP synthase subunit B [Siphonobacter aquaeclarae]SDM91151.1 ATP synthase F0 subcomplex B subunit [Siphonobacter aquaeclarae]
MDLITPSFGLIFWQLVFFLLLVIVLGKFAWKPILASLAEREQSIEDAIELAKKTRAEMAQLKADNDKAKAEAIIERDAILKQARQTAEKMIATAKNEAAQEAKAEIEKARKSFRDEQAAAVAKLKGETAKIAIEIAEKVLRRELADKAAQETLVSEWLKDAKLN